MNTELTYDKEGISKRKNKLPPNVYFTGRNDATRWLMLLHYFICASKQSRNNQRKQ